MNSSISKFDIFKGFFPIAIIILINPFVGMLIALVLVLIAPDYWKENTSRVMTFLLATAIWISLVNITKTIASDQFAYSWLFNHVPEKGFYSTVFESWGGEGKEPVYSFITWILYYLCGGSLRLFFFTISMMIYMFHFMATYKLFTKIDASKGALICGVLVLTFFTQYFVMTLHIIRQMLAAAVAIYAIVYRATEGKYNWWLLIAAPLIHTSAFFLVILSLIPWLYSWMNIKKIAIVLACFIPVIIFSSVIGSKLEESDISALSYAGQRLGEEGATDGGSIKLSIMLTVFIPLGLSSIFLIFRYWNNKRKQSFLEYEEETNDDSEYIEIEEGKNVDDEKDILPIAYLAILTMIFVLSFTKTPLIQYRFFYYSYSFIPLLLPLLFKDRTKISTIYQICISLFFIIRFFMIHNNSDFTYAPAINLIAQPITYYFTGDFSPLYH